MTKSKRNPTWYPAKSYAAGVLDTPKELGVTQEEHPLHVRQWQPNEAEKHPLLIWTGLAPGDFVALRANDAQNYVGMVESKTSDGLMIWMRDEMNERRLFHFQDCWSVQLLH